MKPLPPPDYLRELVDRMRAVLGERLVGVYTAGSLALADFDPTRSDLDVLAACSGEVSAREKRTIVSVLRHESLPCPARGLELVLYPETTLRTPSNDAGFLLNLNTGPAFTFRADVDPSAIERHWFPLDRAIVRAQGVALVGPDPRELIAPIPRELLLPVVAESLAWHLVHGNSRDDDAVLNACRSALWLREGVFASKATAGAWGLEHMDDTGLIVAALRARTGGGTLDRARVDRFVAGVLARATSAAAVAGLRHGDLA